MRQTILNFPKQFKVGIRAAKDAEFVKKIAADNIIICGMGGSALPGDILKTANLSLKLTKLPIFVHRNYGLPNEANKNSLIVCISYSGNTEETISAFNEAKTKGLKIIVISSGGKLINLAKRRKIPFALVPEGIQPRCALGYQFSALAKLLSRMGLIKNIDRELLSLEKNLQPKKFKEKGKKLAEKLKNSIPIIYGSGNFALLAKIWKIKFNENSKILSFFNFFPELNHNEMVGIAENKIKNLNKFLKVIILRDKSGDKKNLKRIKITSEILEKKGINVIFVDIPILNPQRREKFFDKLFSNILLSDWVSYYLALLQKINPEPVKTVEDFKERLAR